MVLSLELLFGDRTERAIRDDWEALQSADLPSLVAHTGLTNRPHVTFAAGPELLIDHERVSNAFVHLPLQVVFGGMLLFRAGRDRWVLARGIVVDAALLDVHRRAHAGLSGAVPLTLPDAWTPHVTIARRLTAEQVARALPVLGAAPRTATFVSARIWDSATHTVTSV